MTWKSEKQKWNELTEENQKLKKEVKTLKEQLNEATMDSSQNLNR